jgi:decaprenyl-phosphate phosphoribosyltransferase
MESLNNLRKLLRVEQWYKNLVIFLPMIFMGGSYSVEQVLLGFLGFCCVSSMTYMINDWVDRKEDLLHPTKKFRPLACGTISGKGALLVSLILAIVVGMAVWFLGIFYGAVVGIYFVATNLYSFGLKNIPLLDVLLIAFNFVLRMGAGMKEMPSYDALPYFALLFGLIVIFLTYKRRADIKLLGEKAVKHKKVLRFYTKRNAYFLRVLGYLILGWSFYELWGAGMEWEKIASLITLLFYTSLLLSRQAGLVIKPHYLFREWVWVVVLIVTTVILFST